MPQELIDALLEPISFLIQYEIGSSEFLIVLVATLAVWIVVARVFMGLLDSDRGILAAVLTLAIPLLSGLFSYGLVEWQIVPMIEAEWAQSYLAVAMSVTVALVIIIFAVKRLTGLSRLASVFVILFASTAAILMSIGTSTVIDALQKGSEKIKEREVASEHS